MSKFQSATYGAVGSQSVMTVKDDNVTIIAVIAPDDAVYDLEVQLDTGGQRHKLVQKINGNYVARIPFGANSIGLDVTALPSGSIILEVLSEVKLIL